VHGEFRPQGGHQEDFSYVHCDQVSISASTRGVSQINNEELEVVFEIIITIIHDAGTGSPDMPVAIQRQKSMPQKQRLVLCTAENTAKNAGAMRNRHEPVILGQHL
jgi:hypothetical protein